jgi:transposase InsO family protein
MIGLPGGTPGCPPDRVNRQFRADRQDALWVSDFTYVSTWQGFAYVVSVQRAGGD